MNRLSDLLVIDQEEAALLLQAWNVWWIPKIKEEKDRSKLLQYQKISDMLRYFLEENT